VHPEKRMDAERMLQGLKPRARELLWLAYVEEMTHREIAAVTGLNVLSIRILLQRARREAQVLAGIERNGPCLKKRNNRYATRWNS